jgi:hypothetical protein
MHLSVGRNQVIKEFNVSRFLITETFLLKNIIYVAGFHFPGTQPGTEAGMDLAVEASNFGELQCGDPITCPAACYGTGTEPYGW